MLPAAALVSGRPFMNNSWVRTLWVVWFAELIAIMGMSLVIPFLPLYLEGELGVAPADAKLWAGLIGGANFLCAALIAPFWGSVADRRGRKPMAIRALLGLAVAVSLMALVRTPLQLFGLRLLQGALGGFVSAAIALVGTSVPRERLGASLGFLQTAMIGGHFVGPLAGGILSTRYGFRSTFLITGGALVLAALLVILLVRENHQPSPESQESNYLANFRLLATMPAVKVLFSVILLTQAGIMLLNSQFSLFVKDLMPDSPKVEQMVGFIFAAPALTGFLMAPLWGRLGDRRGHAVTLQMALLGCTIIFPWGYFASSPWHLFGLRLGIGGLACAINPAAHSIVAHSVPEQRTAGSFSLLASAQMLGAAIGPFLAGPLARYVGVRPLFPLTALLLLAAGLRVVKLRKLVGDSKDENGEMA